MTPSKIVPLPFCGKREWRVFDLAIASGQRWIAGRNTFGPLVPRCNCDRAVLERKEKRSDANAGAEGIGALCTQWIDANGFPADGLESETTYCGEPVDNQRTRSGATTCTTGSSGLR